MRGARFWMSLPFLFPQAMYVRRTAPRFSCAAGPNEGSVGSGLAVRALIFGDSIAAGVGASEYSRALAGQASRALAARLAAEVQWVAHGHIGANSERLLKTHLDELPDGPFHYVALSVGVNDVTSLVTISRWRRNLGTLLRELTARYDAPSIALTGLPPMQTFPLLPEPLRRAIGGRAHELDRAAREVVTRFENVVHVPVEFENRPEAFAGDGYHPSEPSYEIFGEVVGAALARLNHRRRG